MARDRYTRWDRTLDDKLRALYDDARTGIWGNRRARVRRDAWAKIAAELGVTVEAARGRLNTLQRAERADARRQTASPRAGER